MAYHWRTEHEKMRFCLTDTVGKKKKQNMWEKLNACILLFKDYKVWHVICVVAGPKGIRELAKRQADK